MSHRVTRLDHCSEENRKLEKYFGGPNGLPPGLKEVTPEELSQTHFTIAIPEYIQYKQLYGEGLSKFGFKNYDPMVLYHFGKGVGYAIVTTWINKRIRYFTFDCFEKIREDFEALPLKEDSGWKKNKKTSRPMYGISYFDREMTFERTLNDDELDTLKVYLERDRCPGWTGVGIRLVEGNTYHCHTCWDSSD